jgi:CRP-like cAMP-binding protein
MPRPTTASPTILRNATLEDLSKRELFSGDIDKEVLHSIARVSSICKLPPNAYLDATNNNEAALFVITEGWAEVWIWSELTSDLAFFAWRCSEHTLGEISILADDPSSRAFLKVIDPCTLLKIPMDTFLQAANQATQIYKNLAYMLIKKIRQEQQRAAILQISSGITKKVAKALWDLVQIASKQEKNRLIIGGTITQEVLAKYVGYQRGQVNDAIGELRDKAIIETREGNLGSTIIILDIEGLKQEIL